MGFEDFDVGNVVRRVKVRALGWLWRLKEVEGDEGGRRV